MDGEYGGLYEYPLYAALIDIGLIVLFAFQHSLMARPFVKRWIAKSIPPELERSAYVFAANLAGFTIIFLWQPIPIRLWHTEAGQSVLWALFALGWIMLLAGALSIDIFELLGQRQAWAWFKGKAACPLSLKQCGLYRWLTHPMYVGLLLGVWATPDMTVGHALLAVGFTLYILVAMRFEEADLIEKFGTQYLHWRNR